MTRAELDQSNATKILGPGKVNKVRHSQHNTNLANYIDYKSIKCFMATTPAGADLTVWQNDRFDEKKVLKIEKSGGFIYFRDTEFSQAIDPDTDLPVDTLTMAGLYTLEPETTYFITIE